MNRIDEFLSEAKSRDIISAETHAKLDHLKAEFLASETTPYKGNDLSALSHQDDRGKLEDNEAPRLIRGFHDILITIGILVALSGIAILTSAFGMVIAIIVMSEIFIIRQRLALPAYILTVMFIYAMGASLILLTKDLLSGSDSITLLVMTLGLFLSLVLYYKRYRVPFALASLIVSALLTIFSLLLLAISLDGNLVSIFKDNIRLVGGIGLIITLTQFFIAMKFDMQDPERVTRRSDVAFWLHLSTAPLLIYSLFTFIFGNDGFWWSKDPSALDALIAIIIISFMIIVGIVIDRRAFVTAGLISMGVAIYIITDFSGFNSTVIIALSLVAVGIIVLSLGSSWQRLRAIFVSRLPDNVQKVLPPIKH